MSNGSGHPAEAIPVATNQVGRYGAFQKVGDFGQWRNWLDGEQVLLGDRGLL
jgi:hypothetical protein